MCTILFILLFFSTGNPTSVGVSSSSASESSENEESGAQPTTATEQENGKKLRTGAFPGE